MKELTQEELNVLEEQLSCPSGTMGIEVGRRMNESNREMTLTTISNLHLVGGMNVLELGHGNCGHLDVLLNQADVTYVGLEVSETMLQEAQTINQKFIRDRKSVFQLYDGLVIPFPDNTFDRILTVNTIYFWKNPEGLLSEIKRVLKPQGLCLITYAQKSFMSKIPFVKKRFKLYDNNDMQKLAASASLKNLEMFDINETVKSNEGEEVKRIYTIAKLANSKI